MIKKIKKPKAKVIGNDGNIFNVMAICVRALKDAKQYEEAKELPGKVMQAGSYHEALAVCMDYCDLY